MAETLLNPEMEPLPTAKRNTTTNFKFDEDLLSRLNFVKERLNTSHCPFADFTSPEFFRMLAKYRPSTPQGLVELY